jgi:hypothetical protein
MSRIPVAPSEEPIENNGKIETPSRGNEVSVDAVEVPYTDYKNQYNHPYTVDYFKLGDRWQDPVGGFEKEVFLIENYIDNKIQGGEIANSVQAIKDMIKKMEKFNNIDKEERVIIKIETLAHYVEFLMKNEQTRRNLRRYHG